MSARIEQSAESDALTDVELGDLAAAYGWWKAHGDPEAFYDVLDAAVQRIATPRVWAGQAEVANAFVAWAAVNEIAEPPLDWAWFGEIARRYSTLHEEADHGRA